MEKEIFVNWRESYFWSKLHWPISQFIICPCSSFLSQCTINWRRSRDSSYGVTVQTKRSFTCWGRNRLQRERILEIWVSKDWWWWMQPCYANSDGDLAHKEMCCGTGWLCINTSYPLRSGTHLYLEPLRFLRCGKILRPMLREIVYVRHPKIEINISFLT